MSDARAGEAQPGGATGGRVGSLVAAKWRVDARIGSGGMATVYSVTHHRNGQRAALKMLHANLSRDPSTRARFLREGYVANAVSHPGVVTVLDDGVAEDGAAFLVLELLEGETLEARRLRLGGRMPLDEALDIAEEALAALAAAHEKGIVHRDVKPDNVFVLADGRTKLLDFGLARMKDAKAEVTLTGVTIGTPEFMPPEQARGRRDAVDARSDVWGLGATLFTMITGRYVHDDAQSLREQLVASATRRAPPLHQIAPHVSPELASVIDRALELEMSDRWQSAIEMRNALQEARSSQSHIYVGDVPQAAPPPADRAPASGSDHPGSSDKTVRMNAVSAEPPISPTLALERGAPDPSDFEQTLIEAPRPGSLPPPSLPSSRPAGAFRAPLLTPSGEHDTLPARSPLDTGPFDDTDAHAATIASPYRLPLHDASSIHQPNTVPLALPPLHPSQPIPFERSRPTVNIRKKSSAGGTVLVIGLCLLLVCGVMAAYVISRGVPFR